MLETLDLSRSLTKEEYINTVGLFEGAGYTKTGMYRSCLHCVMGAGGLPYCKACQDAIDKEKIFAFARPTVEVTQTEPVTFKATVPLPPTVKLGDYGTIRRKPKKIAVKKAEIDAILEQLRRGRATWEPVERLVKFDDMVISDVNGTIDGKSIINHDGAQYPVRRDASYPAPGFPGELIGMKRDEEKEFKLDFPQDFTRAEMAGKEVSFKVKIIEVKEEKLPELNDELARELDPGFKTVADLRKQVTANMKFRAEEKAGQDFENEVVDEAVRISKVEYPPVLLDMEIDNLVGRQMQQLQRTVNSPEEFRQKLNEVPVEKVRLELKPEAQKRVVCALVLGKIALEEKIEASDKEIEAEIEIMTANVAEDKREEQRKVFNSEENRQQLHHVLITRKTVNVLLDIAKGKMLPKKKKRK